MALMRSEQDWQVTKGSVKERFEELLLLSQWTDCTFSVGEEEEIIKCHKLVLAVSSPVFEALFFGGLAKSEEVIRVPDMDPCIFKLLLKYIYSDSLNLCSIEEAGGLLYAAKKYLMPRVSRECLDYLCDNTGINTLWDVLSIAEALDEPELIARCLKVMCLYHHEVWWDSDRRMSSKTVALLVEQKYMNLSEPELWSILIKWARGECLARGLSETSLRSLFSPVLRSIRFLLFTPSEFQEEVTSAKVLTLRESEALAKAIVASDPALVPHDFSPATEKRLKMSKMVLRCSREVTNQRTASVSFFSGSLISSRLSSSSRVLVTGFEVFTRTTLHNETIRPLKSYRERFDIFLKDTDGNILAKIDHDSTVDFNTIQVITLTRPVVILPSVDYTILFKISSGQYPLIQLTDTAVAKGVAFTFDDSIAPAHISFIYSVLYSL